MLQDVSFSIHKCINSYRSYFSWYTIEQRQNIVYAICFVHFLHWTNKKPLFRSSGFFAFKIEYVFI